MSSIKIEYIIVILTASENFHYFDKEANEVDNVLLAVRYGTANEAEYFRQTFMTHQFAGRKSSVHRLMTGKRQLVVRALPEEIEKYEGTNFSISALSKSKSLRYYYTGDFTADKTRVRPADLSDWTLDLNKARIYATGVFALYTVEQCRKKYPTTQKYCLHTLDHRGVRFTHELKKRKEDLRVREPISDKPYKDFLKRLQDIKELGD